MPKYPGQIDDNTSLPTAVDNVTPIKGSLFNRLRDAVISIESELGVKPSSIYGTVKSRFDNLEGIIGNLEIIELNNDLGGTLSSPKVIGLQGRPLSNTSPVMNQILGWNGIAWAPLSGVLSLGDALSHGNTTDGYDIIFKNNSNILVDPSNTFGFSISWTAGVAGDANPINIIGQNSSGSNGNGGNIFITPGLKNGSGTDGYIGIMGQTQVWSNTNGKLLTIQDSTLLGHTAGAEITSNAESLILSSNKIFLNATNPDLGGSLIFAFSGNDPETNPAVVFANGFMRIYDQSDQNYSLLLDANAARVGLDGISSGSTRTLFISGQSTNGTSGTDGYAGNLFISAGSSVGGSGDRFGGNVIIAAGTGASGNGSISLNSPANLLSTLAFLANTITNTTGNLDITSQGNILTCNVNNGSFIIKTIVDTGNKRQGSWFLIRNIGSTAGPPTTNSLKVNSPTGSLLAQLCPADDEDATAITWAFFFKMGSANTTWTLMASGK
jgi:hypothetical protein